MEVKTVFASKEGKAGDLKAALQKVKDGCVETTGPTGDMIKQVVTIEEGEGDEVVVTVSLPPAQDQDGADAEMEEAMENPPKFTASLSFGRDIAQMHAHIGDAFALVPNGIKGHVDAAFAHGLLKAAEDEAGVSDDNLSDEFLMMKALTSIKASHEIRYRAGDPPPAIFSRMHSLKEEVESFAEDFASGPPVILKAIAKLPDFADGLKSVELRGLPHKFEVLFAFKNFHVTPLLKDFIGDLEDAEEGEEAAPDPAPEDATDDAAEE